TDEVTLELPACRIDVVLVGADRHRGGRHTRPTVGHHLVDQNLTPAVEDVVPDTQRGLVGRAVDRHRLVRRVAHTGYPHPDQTRRRRRTHRPGRHASVTG